MDKNLESLVPLTPEWLKPHLEHGFLNLKELGLDRRETKILQEEFLKLNPYSDEFYKKKGPFQHRWSESDPISATGSSATRREARRVEAVHVVRLALR